MQQHVKKCLLFALNDLFGIKSLPETRVYWSKDNFVGVPTVQKVKPRNRFDKIRQYLSLNNRLYMLTQDDPGYVKLFKVRSLLDRLDSRIHEEYQPSKFISIDEWSSTKEDGFKQYKHMKPVKRGSKVWVRGDETNSFVSAMQVYTGKKSGGQPKHGLGHRDVSDLVSDLMGKNYHIFCDNFFTSVRLAEDLLSDKLYLCGTTLAKLSFVGEETLLHLCGRTRKPCLLLVPNAMQGESKP